MLAAATLLLVVTVTGCGGGGGDAALSGPAAGLGPAATTVTTAPAPVGGASTTPSTTARPAGPGSSASTTTAPAAATPTTAPGAGAAALTPAAPGTYRYDTSGFSRFGAATNPLPAVTTLVVDPPAGSRQHAARDLRDAYRNGPVFESTLEYRPDGVYLAKLGVTTTVLLFSTSEELSPPTPVLFLPTGARPGFHRELDVPGRSATAHLVLDVLREERLAVAGQAVETIVVRLVATVPSPLNARLELTVWVAPASRLWVKERLVADATAGDGGVQFHSEYDAVLQRLTPS